MYEVKVPQCVAAGEIAIKAVDEFDNGTITSEDAAIKARHANVLLGAVGRDVRARLAEPNLIAAERRAARLRHRRQPA